MDDSTSVAASSLASVASRSYMAEQNDQLPIAAHKTEQSERLAVFCVLAKALVMNPCMGVNRIIMAIPARDETPVSWYDQRTLGNGR